MNLHKVFLNEKDQISFYGKAFSFAWDVEEDNYQLRVYLDFPNERLKVLDYRGEPSAISDYLLSVARKNQVGKILFNVRQDWREYLEYGFIKEGEIPGYFDGEEAHCLSFFSLEERRKSKYLQEEQEILKQVLAVEPENVNVQEPDKWEVASADASNAHELAELYDSTFRSYPTPLNNAEYIKQVMDSHVEFLMVLDEGKIISSASAERNIQYNNAEMTDCATRPDYRGEGLMSYIIKRLGKEMEKKGLNVIYSLARARSVGMNMVFRKLGYDYMGQFINNCHICGRYEDMNLWVKVLHRQVL